ncbi:MAG: sensor hybrid histidine kinase [Deltaproteobacteria bacterium]|nr:sensor hybrid histidine kinase [Deltaproteobacteria bacterium]
MNGTTILIVEDEAIVAADLDGKLRRLGYEVAGIAASGEEAVAMALRLRPRLVLMDIKLEGPMDGIEAIEAIRGRYDVPVIYLTAHSDAATLARAKVTGPAGYLLKPFEERDLATQIELALYKHQADRQLQEQREWLRVTLTSIGDAVVATDAEGRIAFINPVAASLTGWTGEEAAGRPLSKVVRFIDERTGQAAPDPVASVLLDGRTVTMANHTALVTRDGRAVPVEDSAAPIRDAAGRVIGAVLVFHEVTDRRRAEEARRKAVEELEKRTLELNAILSSVQDYLYILDPEGRFVFANKKMLDLWGRSAEQAIGRTMRDLDYPKDVETAFREAMEAVLRTGEVVVNETRYVSPAGVRGTYENILAPMPGPGGRITLIAGSSRDISGRKNAEMELDRLARERELALEALRRSQEDLVRAQAVSRTGSWRLNVGRNELIWSEETHRIFGVPKGMPLTYESFLSAVHPDDREFVDGKWKAAIRGEPYDIEHRIVVGGREKWVREKAELEFDPRGALLGGFGTVQDVTERKRMEKALRESLAEKKVLLEKLTNRMGAGSIDGE